MPVDSKNKKLLILSQVYLPDHVGQHGADVAVEMVRRGYHVTVLTANRGYNNPTVKYPSHELIQGVYIRRLPFSSFGKKSIFRRSAAAVCYLIQATFHGVLARPDAILVGTSPPMCAVAAMIIAAVLRVPIKHFIMDLNPDQVIAIGLIRPKSIPARGLEWLARLVLRRAQDVIVLDRFMAERVNAKHPLEKRLSILPPWPHDEDLGIVPHQDNRFRAEHSFGDKLVFMYSGNHSLVSPVSTLLEAALRLKDDPSHVFAFVGGGPGKVHVDDAIQRHNPPNIISLPYQPQSEIKYSLSAADIHIVALGDNMVGISHPCKVYSAMAVARPILLLGPDSCHVSDLLEEYQIGWKVSHGDVDGAVKLIRKIIAMKPIDRIAMGNRAFQAMNAKFNKALLRGQFCDIIEKAA